MTKQRAAILEVIRSDKCHHTAEEILALARQKLPSISRATVYNNLKSLEEEQIIRKITGDDASARYDGSFIPHGHMLCDCCGRVWDFSISELGSLITDAIGQSFDSYELKVRIRCEDCKEARVNNP